MYASQTPSQRVTSQHQLPLLEEVYKEMRSGCWSQDREHFSWDVGRKRKSQKKKEEEESVIRISNNGAAFSKRRLELINHLSLILHVALVWKLQFIVTVL